MECLESVLLAVSSLPVTVMSRKAPPPFQVVVYSRRRRSVAVPSVMSLLSLVWDHLGGAVSPLSLWRECSPEVGRAFLAIARRCSDHNVSVSAPSCSHTIPRSLPPHQHKLPFSVKDDVGGVRKDRRFFWEWRSPQLSGFPSSGGPTFLDGQRLGWSGFTLRMNRFFSPLVRTASRYPSSSRCGGTRPEGGFFFFFFSRKHRYRPLDSTSFSYGISLGTGHEVLPMDGRPRRWTLFSRQFSRGVKFPLL